MGDEKNQRGQTEQALQKVGRKGVAAAFPIGGGSKAVERKQGGPRCHPGGPPSKGFQSVYRPGPIIVSFRDLRAEKINQKGPGA